MRANIVKIGNSRGVRIPKPLLDQLGIGDAVELTIEGEKLVVTPIKKHPRDGWAEALEAAIAEHGDDAADFADWDALDDEAVLDEWTWPESDEQP